MILYKCSGHWPCRTLFLRVRSLRALERDLHQTCSSFGQGTRSWPSPPRAAWRSFGFPESVVVCLGGCFAEGGCCSCLAWPRRGSAHRLPGAISCFGGSARAVTDVWRQAGYFLVVAGSGLRRFWWQTSGDDWARASALEIKKEKNQSLNLLYFYE